MGKGKKKSPPTCYFWHDKLVCNYSYSSLRALAVSALPAQRNKAVITNQVDSSVIMRVSLTAGYLQLSLHFMNRDQPSFNWGDCRKVSRWVNSEGCNLGQIFRDLRMQGDVFVNRFLQSPIKTQIIKHCYFRVLTKASDFSHTLAFEILKILA